VWTVQDGLPINSINDLLQSRNGYIWAATFDGLVRFDGVRFTVYNTGNTKGLPSNRIVDLSEGPDGSLWLITEQRHLVRFRDGSFTLFGPEHGLADAVYVVHIDAAGTVWVGVASGLGMIREDRFLPVAADVITGSVGAIAGDADDLLVAGYSRTIYRYHGDSTTVIARHEDGVIGLLTPVFLDDTGTPWVGTDMHGYRIGADGPERVFGSVREFLAAPNGTLWTHGAGGIVRLQNGALVRVSDQRQSVGHNLLLADGDGHVWSASGTKVYRDDELIYSLAPEAGDVPVPAAEVRAIVLDHEGSLWIGTNADGLHQLKPSLFTVLSRPEGLPHQNVYPVLEDRVGDIWVGTWGGGLARVRGGRASRVPGTGGFVLSLMEDDTGVIWVGGYSGGLRLCRPEPLRCELESEKFRFGVFRAMYQDRSGSIWLGSRDGLFRSGAGGFFRQSEADGAPGAPVRVFLETKDGALWMGTNGAGLVRYRDGEFQTFGASDGAPSDLIRSLYQDTDGWLWIGTEGRGLARIDPETWPLDDNRKESVVTFRSTDGLFDDVIHQILEDDFGRMWMSTNRGIFWVARHELNSFADGATDRIHSTGYTERHGLRNREANGGFQPAGIKARDGRLWFPTQDGVAVVDPARLERNLVPPPVVVERLAAGGEVYRPGGEPVTLDPGHRDLQIDYTALSFVAPENMRFRYRLEGYNDDWVEAGTRRTAFYTNIPPGSYTFHVIASNEEGVWNEAGAALSLSVTPFFYETNTWYLFLAIALALITLGAFRWRGRIHHQRERHLTQLVEARTDQVRRHEAQLEEQNTQLEEQAARLTELVAAKSHFFANVSHEFRTPLTLTIGPLEDLRNGLYGSLAEEPSRQLGMALRNARRLLRLVNQILDVAKLESGHMQLRARRHDFAEFLRDIATTFAPVAERQGVRFAVEVPARQVPLWFDGEAMETVLTNLLSNSFKFTAEGGQVSLSLEADTAEGDQGTARVRIADSGQGIAPGDLQHVFDRFYQVDESRSEWQSGTGIGLSLARDLVELHRGTIQVESDPGEGTTFTITLHRGRSHLRDDQAIDDAAPARTHSVPSIDEPPVQPAAMRGVDGETPESDEPDDIQTILVVDDNADIREYVGAHLAQRYRVVEATDGVEGLAEARRLIPDLVISDVMMPGMDGYGLCRSLRASPDTDFLPVILLTAKADTEHKVEGLSEGADDYVVKPFEMEELEARVANLIASRRRLRERFGSNGGEPGESLQLHAAAREVTSADAAYLERLRTAIEERLSDESFGVAQLAEAMGQDRSHMYRRVRSLLDETPTDLIRRLRLERASQLLAGESGTVAEVGYAVGFNSVSYFCKCFRDAYGITPSAFRGSPRA